MSVFGLGKQRSKLGRFVDKNGIPVVALAKESGVNRKTLGRACADPYYIPTGSTMKKILKALRQIDPSISANSFWDM
jgi:predicted regulator of amino acid metabolism with ACT domain